MSGNKYKYLVQESVISLPKLGDDLSEWNDWNGTNEITATNGYNIVVAEVESNNTCEKVGVTIVESLLASSTAGTYDATTSTFTAGETGYTFTQKRSNTVEVTGTIPYESAVESLELEAGNRLTFKVKNSSISSNDDLPSGVVCTVTTTAGEITYEKTDFELDGSFICLVNIPDTSGVTLDINWGSGSVRYTYDVTKAEIAEQE